jgi:hypothetical protein
MKGTALKVSRQAAPPPLPMADRGYLIDKYDVSRLFFNGKRPPRWCAEHVAPKQRKVIGGRFMWYESDVRAWLDNQ